MRYVFCCIRSEPFLPLGTTIHILLVGNVDQELAGGSSGSNVLLGLDDAFLGKLVHLVHFKLSPLSAFGILDLEKYTP